MAMAVLPGSRFKRAKVIKDAPKITGMACNRRRPTMRRITLELDSRRSAQPGYPTTVLIPPRPLARRGEQGGLRRSDQEGGVAHLAEVRRVQVQRRRVGNALYVGVDDVDRVRGPKRDE